MESFDKFKPLTIGGYHCQFSHIVTNDKYPLKGYALINKEQKKMEWTIDGKFDERVERHMFDLELK